MTREEAIAYFKDMNECTYGGVEPIQMAIKALSSSEKPNKWIPVEKALPDEGLNVLVYAERNSYGVNGKFTRRKVIDIGWQVDGRWHIDGCSGVVGIAWMPLPTPPNKSEIPTGEEVEVSE